MRMLEIFSSNVYIDKYIPKDNPQVSRTYLENIFCYLIRQKYFKVVRQLIEEKIPAVDEDTITIPNPIADALLQMLLRPLKLLPTSNEAFNKNILQSFTFHILSPAFSDQVKHYIVPSLAKSGDFPYICLIRYIAEEYQLRLDYQNTILIDIDDEMDDGAATATTKTMATTGGESSTVSASKKPRRNLEKETLVLSSSLLYCVMRLGDEEFGKSYHEENKSAENYQSHRSLTSIYNFRKTQLGRIVRCLRESHFIHGQQHHQTSPPIDGNVPPPAGRFQ